ncbi:MAG: hypothetical protein ACUVT1_07335 [Anaerolineae bacterium]
MSWWRASRLDRQDVLAAFLLALPLLAAGLATGWAFPAQTDEVKFHWEVIQEFARQWPQVPWQDYHSATGPLPYMLWAAWGRVFGMTLPALRVLTTLMSWAGLLAFYRLARRQGYPMPLLVSLVLALSPYGFLHSFTIYTVNMGLVFAVLAMGWYLDAGTKGWKALLAGGLFATLAAYCRQHYLFLPAGVGIWWLVRAVRRRRVTGSMAVDALLIALPALLVAPLFAVWGGLVPPSMRGLHPLRLHPEHVMFLLIFAGLYGAPAGWTAWPAVWKDRRSTWLLLALPAYVLFRPAFGPGVPDTTEGIILHALSIGQAALGPLLPWLAEGVLWLNGLAMGTAWWLGKGWRIDDKGRMLWGWTAAFTGMVGISDYVGERFYALWMPAMILLLDSLLGERRSLRWVWLAGTAGMTAVYCVVKMSAGAG